VGTCNGCAETDVSIIGKGARLRIVQGIPADDGEW